MQQLAALLHEDDDGCLLVPETPQRAWLLTEVVKQMRERGLSPSMDIGARRADRQGDRSTGSSTTSGNTNARTSPSA